MGATKLPAEPQLMLWEEASLLGPGVLAGRHEVLSCEATHAHIPKPSAGFRSGSSFVAGKGDRYHPIDARFGGGGSAQISTTGGAGKASEPPPEPSSLAEYRSGALAAPPAVSYASAARAFISPTAFEQARGGALGARGGGRVGFAGGGLF